MNVRILLVLLSLCVIEASAATVSGTVTFVTRRGQRPVADETVVWLERMGEKLPRPAPLSSSIMTSRAKTLIPHVLVIPVGSTVSFPNEDAVTHNLFSGSQPNKFDLGLYRRGTTKTQKFDNPGIVNVYCNVHPGMSAVIHVMETPLYAQTTANGQYVVRNVPPGRYRLTAWNEVVGTAQSEIEVTASGTVKGPLALQIDGRSFRDAGPHLNKDGQPYGRSRDY